MRNKGFNNYKILGDTTVIYINRRDGISLGAIIDTEDLYKINQGNMRWGSKKSEYSDAYYVRWTKYLGIFDSKPKYEMVYIHQLIMPYDTSIYLIDHKNKNGLDNRKENLRLIDKIGNAQNRKGANKNNITGCRNVSLIDGKYLVQLQIDGKNVVLGEFNDLDIADNFAEQMRIKYYDKYIPLVNNPAM